MYTNSYGATALAAAAFFVLLPQEVRAQSGGAAFSSNAILQRPTPRDIRYLAEPDLVFDWKKIKEADVEFEPEISTTESDLIPQLFPVVTGGDLGGQEETDSATDGQLRAGTRSAPILFPEGQNADDSSLKQRGIAEIDDYSNVPHSKIFEKKEDTDFRPGGDPFIGEAYTGNSGYNTGSQTEQIIQIGGPMPRIDYSRVRPLRKTLHDIWQAESAYMQAGKVPTKAQRARLHLLYRQAASQEDNQVMSAYYLAMSSLIAENIGAAFAQIDKIYKLSPDNDKIFKEIAEEFRYEKLEADARIIELYPKGVGKSVRLRLLTKSGMKALERHDWNTAWQTFEKVYELKPDPELILEIAYFYYQEGRDMETCIWCSRCLPVAEFWETFESAWALRETIEAAAYAEFLSREPKITAHWSAAKVPLKVYFETEAAMDAEFYILMEECLKDWMFVARGKLDYEMVFEEDKADLVIARPQIPVDTRYERFRGGSSPPVGVPQPQPLGEAIPVRNGLVMTKARINMFDSMQDLDEQTRVDVYLHELGHALGLIGHSKDPNDLMYAYGRQSRESLFMDNNVSYGDFQRFRAAYKNVPLNSIALEKYTGMRARCQRLQDNPQKISNLELPDHLANLMPVLESIDFNETKASSDESTSDPTSSASSEDEDPSQFWSPSTHYMPGCPYTPPLSLWDDPLSNYPIRTGQVDFDFFRDLPDL